MTIAAHDITLAGFDHPFRLLDFQMELKPNAHAWAKLHLRLDERLDIHVQLNQDTTLRIGYHKNGGVAGTLFCGVVEHVSMKRKDQYYELFIDLVSGSTALDKEKKQVAYQDDMMTYAQVTAQALSETADAKMILATESDVPIGAMLVQYNETDWAFAKRLASHLEEAIFPDWRTGSPAFYFGTKMNTGRAVITAHDYITVLDPRFYAQGGFLKGYSKRDFVYIQTKTTADYAPGTVAHILDADRRVMYKHAALHGDEVHFTYHWNTVYKVAYQHNEKLIGVMLSGTVLEVVDECVKIVLDIDAVNTTIFHPWTPVTGNIFYCMPEIGTRVMLYLGSRIDSDAKAVENIRENGGIQPRAEDGAQVEREYHGRLLDPDDRYFASQHEKELSILPASIGLGPREKTPKMAVIDQSGVMIDDLTLTLQANGNVAFQGDTINIVAPSQVSAVRAGNGPMSTFSISKDFNVCGTIGSMNATRREAMRISKPSTVEALGSPREVEQAAISAVPLQSMTLEKSNLDVLQNEVENIMYMSGISEKKMQELALSLVPMGSSKKVRDFRMR